MAEYEIAEDGLLREIVGAWATEKHERLERYIDISKFVRRKFLTGPAKSATYIDLFCGTGQGRVRDTPTVIDGSPLVAFRTARDGGQAFTEMHLGDLNGDAVRAAKARITATGGKANIYIGKAEDVADEIVKVVNPHGLHFALLDPYSLESLSFDKIKALAVLKHVDMLLHVSAMDMQRNFDTYVDAEETPFDRFAPGWRSVVDVRQSQAAARAALLKYWGGLVESLGFDPPRYDLVTGSKSQRLYWLAFISRNPKANEFWKKIRYIDGQTDLFGRT